MNEVSYFDDIRQIEADGSGVADLVFDPVPNGVVHEIDRIVVVSDGAAVPEARFYKNEVSVQNIVTGSLAADFDEGEYDAPIRLTAGERLVARFTGATAGSLCLARVQIRALARESSRSGRSTTPAEVAGFDNSAAAGPHSSLWAAR